MKATVLHNQSLLDIAIQHTGSVLNAFQITVANGISLTDDLTPGLILTIPENVVFDTDILNYYTSKKIQPATAIENIENTEEPTQEGISHWAINNDFIIGQ